MLLFLELLLSLLLLMYDLRVLDCAISEALVILSNSLILVGTGVLYL